MIEELAVNNFDGRAKLVTLNAPQGKSTVSILTAEGSAKGLLVT
jgi:hypothetical protein